MVECECLSDPEALHDCETDRIGEREILVVVLDEDRSRTPLIPGAGAHEDRVTPLNLAKDTERCLTTEFTQQHRMGLGENEVGRDEKSTGPRQGA